MVNLVVFIFFQYDFGCRGWWYEEDLDFRYIQDIEIYRIY